MDSAKTAQIVLLSFDIELSTVVKQLKDDELLLYGFLRGVFSYKSVLYFCSFRSIIVCFPRDTGDSAIYMERNIAVQPEVHEKYIALMCKVRFQRYNSSTL